MGDERLGSWEPIEVSRAAALFRPANFRWWLSGGHALDAHLGDSWRAHDDTDIGIRRADVHHVPEVLPGWEIHTAAAGVLSPWHGGPLAVERSENNLWCRPSAGEPWALDITIGDGDEHEWIYRRDPSVRRPWADAVLTGNDRVPYLAPELQLLFKAKTIRAKDDLDATVVIPRLEPERRRWLGAHLPADHPWQRLAGAQRGAD